VRLSARIRAVYDDLQPFQSLGSTRNLGKSVLALSEAFALSESSDDRLHSHKGASLRSGRKRGAQEQAIGRSRGGRNTKIHALADAKGRLISLFLTGGDTHDCPAAENLIDQMRPAKHFLGDKAYDSADLRRRISQRGARPVIPNRSCRKQPFAFNRRLYKQRWLIENAFNRIKDYRRIAMRYDKLARNYFASVCIAGALVWWL
jgi:transposase